GRGPFGTQQKPLFARDFVERGRNFIVGDGDGKSLALAHRAQDQKSPTACGTRIPDAMVCASSHRGACSVPFSKARPIGAQPAACTATIRGRFAPTKPIASNSAKAFHIPISPVPPPVG